MQTYRLEKQISQLFLYSYTWKNLERNTPNNLLSLFLMFNNSFSFSGKKKNDDNYDIAKRKQQSKHTLQLFMLSPTSAI